MATERWNLRIRKLRQIQKLDLDLIEEHAINKIKHAIQDLWITGEQIYVAFSGGKDSIVASHMTMRALKEMCVNPQIKHVYEQTLLEHRSINRFVKQYFNHVPGTTVYPEIKPHEVVKRFGYPFLGKRIAEHIERIRNGRTSNWFTNTYPKYVPLASIQTHISASCCHHLKKAPVEKWLAENQHIKAVVMGTRADESMARRQQWVENSCVYTPPDGVTRILPLSYFSEAHVWAYIEKHNLEYPNIYNCGYTRSGCMTCGFGCHVQSPNRFQVLRNENYPFYEAIMKEWGYADAIHEINETMGYELIKGGLYEFGGKKYQLSLEAMWSKKVS